jgi:beta-glucanase (GH16 family)
MMRLLLAATMVFVTHAGVPASDVPQVSPAPVAVFFDDFSGPDVNRAHWNVIVTGRVVNNEQQAYVDSADTIRIVHGAEADGAENGALAIRPQFRSGFMTPEGRSFDFVSGRIESRGKAEFTHGTVAARIKLPAGAGLWPAVWMLGTGRWPDTGELDIMENVGDASWTNVALHGPGYSGNTPLVARRSFPAPADATGWHVYAVEWTPDGFVFSVDGDAFYRPSRADVERHGRWVYDTPKFLIVNFALGGQYPQSVNKVTAPYPGLPPSTVDLLKTGHVRMLVDWVRVTRP